ncbi:MAG TPA: hypothetical protein VNV66_04520 [Pilimelia sp.]|nr:hypothetical protein [Pilimelia sp.]
MLPQPPRFDLLERLVAAPGLYRGRGDGPESGPFLARMRVSPVVRGRAVTLDFEATAEPDGLRRLEYAVLAVGDGGRPELYVAGLELPGMVRFVATGPEEFTAYDGQLAARIVLTAPRPGTLTYAWWWSRDGSAPREQSRADLRLTG